MVFFVRPVFLLIVFDTHTFLAIWPLRGDFMFRTPCHASHLLLRPSLIATCLAFSLSAHAQSFTLQLPAQALTTSLSQVAQQTKIQLLFDEKQLKHVQAPALNGDFTAEVAIRTLLNNGEFTLIKVGSKIGRAHV